MSTLASLVKRNSLVSKDIASIGITNQRETTIVWDKKDGKPIYNAIVWQDRRTADFCNELNDQKKWLIPKQVNDGSLFLFHES